jgi:hypothetical protein
MERHSTAAGASTAPVQASTASGAPRAPAQASTASGAATTPAQANRAPCPTFTLRADHQGHLRALLVAINELPAEERKNARSTLREFELWEETHR